jgi:hypothetical protein
MAVTALLFVSESGFHASRFGTAWRPASPPAPAMPNAWYVNRPTSDVASFFARGAYQQAWSFVAGSSATVAPNSSVMSYTFRFTKAPTCRGALKISPETLRGGASVYQMIPDAP